MLFKDIRHLAEAFTTPTCTIPEKIEVNGVQYVRSSGNNVNVLEALKGAMMTVAYTSDQCPTIIGLNWAYDQRLGQFVPHSVGSASPLTEATIGLDVEMEFVQYGATLKAKVDTGADMCSLHAENIQINNGMVSFTSKFFGDRNFKAHLADTQIIQSADGGDNQRPVISCNVRVAGEEFADVLFNLNDRSNMDTPVLMGQNLLTKGQFLINPSMQADPQLESATWNALSSDNHTVTARTTVVSYDKLRDALNVLEHTNMTIGDVVRAIRTHAVETAQF